MKSMIFTDYDYLLNCNSTGRVRYYRHWIYDINGSWHNKSYVRNHDGNYLSVKAVTT